MNETPHVLVVNVHFDPDIYGGATIVAGEVARRLHRKGHRVSAIATMSNADLPPYTVVRSQRDGLECYRINLPTNPSQHQAHRDDIATQRVMQIVKTLKPDVAHVHCIQGLGAGMLAEFRAIGLPSILSVHDFWWMCERQFMVRADGRYCGQDPIRISECAGCVTNIAKTTQRSSYLFDALSHADLVTFPSSFAHGLSMRSGLPARRCVVWENGITLPGPTFFEAQAARRVAKKRMTFGFVGGPSSVKGWPLVREAFQRLDTNNFDGLVVDASLDGNWWRPNMLQGLPGQWDIHPRYEQGVSMDRFFAQIDVLLFLSQWREAFGLVVREALSRGIRVIQTSGGGATEHGAASRQIPIGASPDQLSSIIGEELRRPNDHPDPVPCRSFDDQADEFLSLIRGL